MLVPEVSADLVLLWLGNFSLTINSLFISGAATTASRLGQPDLAIATLNDFVEVTDVYRYSSSPFDLMYISLVCRDGL